MGHGNVHWSGNFDEIQDFELDIVNGFNGLGFTQADGGPHPPLGSPNAGRDNDLDALAAYVASLNNASYPRSPYKDSGRMTAEAMAGAQIFRNLGCTQCHNPDTHFTDSQLGSPNLHDLGTLKATSGERLGASLLGIDTPTLIGVHATAPYLHDGSASTLRAVFDQFDASAPANDSRRGHDIRSLNPQQKSQLIDYLLQLDGHEETGSPMVEPINFRLQIRR